MFPWILIEICRCTNFTEDITEVLKKQLISKIENGDFVEIDLTNINKFQETDLKDKKSMVIPQSTNEYCNDILILKNFTCKHEEYLENLKPLFYHVFICDDGIEYLRACNFYKGINCRKFSINQRGDQLIINFYVAKNSKLKIYECSLLKDFLKSNIKEKAKEIIHKTQLDKSFMLHLFEEYFLDAINDTMFETTWFKDVFDFWIVNDRIIITQKNIKDDTSQIDNDISLSTKDINFDAISMLMDDTKFYDFVKIFNRVLYNEDSFKYLLLNVLKNKNGIEEVFSYILQNTGFDYKRERNTDKHEISNIADHFMECTKKYKTDKAIKFMNCFLFVNLQIESNRKSKDNEHDSFIAEMHSRNKLVTKNTNLNFLSFCHKVFNSIENLSLIKSEIENNLEEFCEKLIGKKGFPN